jgi:spermidine synthase
MRVSSAVVVLVMIRSTRADSHETSAAGAAFEILPDGSAEPGTVSLGATAQVGPLPDDKDSQQPRPYDHGKALLDWLRSSPGGYAHPAIAIIPSQDGPQQSGNNSTIFSTTAFSYGVFATEEIQKGEVLLEIPRTLVLQPGLPTIGDRVVVENQHRPCVVTGIDPTDDSYRVWCPGYKQEIHGIDVDSISHEDVPVNCALVRLLASEMRLGDRSAYAPYVSYLNSLPRSKVPAAWSASGQRLLLEVLGHAKDDEEGDNDDKEQAPVLPPEDPLHGVKTDWHHRCGGSASSALEEAAYYMVKQRSWDDLMVPVFDMMSHRNGRWTNTDNMPFLGVDDDDEDKPEDERASITIKVFANRTIRKGEEIYTSYNMCQDCVGRLESLYGTAEILRDYGFVEDYPRRFDFEDENGRISFDMDYRYDEVSGESKDEVVLNWIGDPPSFTAVQSLYESLDRLRKLNETTLSDPALAVPSHELSMIQQYVDALIAAMTKAIATAHGYDDTSLVSPPIMLRYPRLEMMQPESWINTRPETCDWQEAFHYGRWNNIAKYTTPYQEMEFDVNPHMGSNNGDLCFDLDTVVQMCTSYRPQYHELFVHYPARFLPKIERILFVGGGDSMLLHEALKYPTLEKVVGLELDQAVVRASFEHFGTQPHWDNEKVEWWFGDATKSLLVLPKEYFGSFDLVLVDLSETVMALSVTDGLDVMQALTLLVKHGGIMVQNEYDHFLEYTRLFRNSLTIHYYGVPIVCSQSLILASNGVDFLRGRFKSHNVSYLYDLLEEPNLQHEIIRDYQRNSTNPHHCYKQNSPSQNTTTNTIPGVFMVLEIERASVDLSSCSSLKNLSEQVLKDQDLAVFSSVSKEYGSGCQLALVLQQGLVIARSVANAEYVAFDLHFWSDFHLQEPTRHALVRAMSDREKGASSSAYRIVVVGGMLRSSDHERISKTLGPHIEDFCGEAAPPIIGNLSLSNHTDPMEKALLESFLVADDEDFRESIAVMCGPMEGGCKSLEILTKWHPVSEVLVIPSCKGIFQGGYKPKAISAKSMKKKNCEEEVTTLLVNFKRKIRALVVDPTATYELAQVVGRILLLNKDIFMAKNVFVQATVLDGNSWRKAFVDQFRSDEFGEEPAFRAEVTFETSDTHGTNFTVIMASSGNFLFPKRLSQFAERMEVATSHTARINDIRSGDFRWEEDFKAHAIYSHDSYDRTDQRRQWQEQNPAGLQSITQLTNISSVDGVCADLAGAFPPALSKALPLLSPGQILTLNQAVGHGCVLIWFWDAGSASITFDGRQNAILNLFLHGNGSNDAQALERMKSDLRSELLRILQGASTLLVDWFPRGSGRTILYPKPDRIPLWW